MGKRIPMIHHSLGEDISFHLNPKWPALYSGRAILILGKYPPASSLQVPLQFC